MKKQNYFNRFYLDKEKDIIVTLYKENEDELEYIIETPNHHTGNLITNLAKVCKVETKTGENEMRVIKGKLPASINGDNEEVYIFRLGGIKIANIYADGVIEMKAKIPAITKTLMAQTKSYKLDINKYGIISSLECKGDLRRRLLDLGLIDNTKIKCLYKSPFNDPTAYLIRGSVIALRKSDTKDILIDYNEEGIDYNGTY